MKEYIQNDNKTLMVQTFDQLSSMKSRKLKSKLKSILQKRLNIFYSKIFDLLGKCVQNLIIKHNFGCCDSEGKPQLYINEKVFC